VIGYEVPSVFTTTTTTTTTTTITTIVTHTTTTTTTITPYLMDDRGIIPIRCGSNLGSCHIHFLPDVTIITVGEEGADVAFGYNPWAWEEEGGRGSGGQSEDCYD